MQAFWEENGAHFCPLEMPLYRAARLRLEGMYREQQQEIANWKAIARGWKHETDVRDRQILEKSAQLASLKEEQLTAAAMEGRLLFVIEDGGRFGRVGDQHTYTSSDETMGVSRNAMEALDMVMAIYEQDARDNL